VTNGSGTVNGRKSNDVFRAPRKLEHGENSMSTLSQESFDYYCDLVGIWRPPRFLSVAALSLALGFTSLALAANPPQYSVTDLGTLGGTTSSGNGINASGQVTGSSTLNALTQWESA
jgi:hypothetical protein